MTGSPSDRDHSPFAQSPKSRPATPTAKEMIPPHLPASASKSQWESDMLDQEAAQKLFLDGIYKRAGHQAKALQRIAEQSEVQTRYLRDMRSYLLFGVVVPTCGMIAALIIVALVYIRSLQ